MAATTNHRFRVGSGAKPVTATLAAIMADEGLLNLDGPIARYMTHARIQQRGHPRGLHQRPIDRHDNVLFHIRVHVASLALEQAAGTPFLDLLQRKIAAPLGLVSLSADAPRRVVRDRVHGYGRASEVRELREQPRPACRAMC